MKQTAFTDADINRWRGKTIGLLGGSFNPAHDGHKYIAESALKIIGLNAVWLMVSPGNPLKPSNDMAPFEDRYASAQIQASHPQVFACDIEVKMGTCRTLDSVKSLQKAMPETKFVWLMGADNMQQFDKWFGWQEIVACIPIAIFDRPTYAKGALNSRFADDYADNRVDSEELTGKASPAWCFVQIPLHHASATQIRAKKGLKNPDA